jgi:protein tyrosine/serine phosphatase
MAKLISKLLFGLRVGARAIAAVVLLAGAWFGYRYAVGNIHTVESGVLYRSGTLFGHSLASLIDEKGIRTIINLRGPNPGRVWYDTERAVGAEKGVVHIDVGMSARRDPKDETIDALLHAFATAPRPILVHCEAGADRSSFASAVFAYVELGQSAEEAARQISLYYGHETITDRRKLAMRRAFDRVVARQGLQRREPGKTVAVVTDQRDDRSQPSSR